MHICCRWSSPLSLVEAFGPGWTCTGSVSCTLAGLTAEEAKRAVEERRAVLPPRKGHQHSKDESGDDPDDPAIGKLPRGTLHIAMRCARGRPARGFEPGKFLRRIFLARKYRPRDSRRQCRAAAENERQDKATENDDNR